MNKTRLLLPLAALLMTPTMTSCGPDKYQAAFNNDQYICAYGTQIIDVTLDRYVKSKLEVKSTLSAADFSLNLPKKYQSTKEIKFAKAYSKDSFFLVVGGEITNLTDSDSFDIKVKESAFTTPNLGGSITVSLFRNEIRYDGYSSESIGPASYEGTNKVELIGADFIDGLVNTDIALGPDGKPTDTSLSDTLTVNNIKEGGLLTIVETDKGIYIYLKVDFEKDAEVSVTFNASATDLEKSCTYIPHGLGGGDHNYFE